jgi:hypothetical protein
MRLEAGLIQPAPGAAAPDLNQPGRNVEDGEPEDGEPEDKKKAFSEAVLAILAKENPPTQVNVGSPQVTVNPPEVHVESPTVNVAAPNVKVDTPAVNVSLPPMHLNVTLEAPKVGASSSKRIEVLNGVDGKTTGYRVVNEEPGPSKTVETVKEAKGNITAYNIKEEA